jgi:ribosomal protein S18 acetylase RimI-like enzyme
MTTQATIRLLTPDDTDAFVRIRREALESEPLAFAASLEDDRGLDADFVRQSLVETNNSAVFGAFSPELVGVVGLYRDGHDKAAHKVHIWGMFVRLAFRKFGIGNALFSTAIRHARGMSRVSQIHLGVSETAEAARHLYERHGFKIWGTEPRALNYQGQFVAEHHMVLMLE